MKAFKIFCLSMMFCIHVFADSEEERIKAFFLYPEITELSVSDWCNPTYEDYAMIQQRIRTNLYRVLETPISQRVFATDRLNDHDPLLGWITYRLGRIQLVKPNDPQGSVPQFGVVYINDNPEKKDKCVICYTAYGYLEKDWPRGIQLMIHKLKQCNFDGHFIYRIGGWPGLAKGRLKYADTPYSFKPFFCEEAKDMGYKQILWLDACVIPVKGLEPIFTFIKQRGACFFSDGNFSHQRMEDRGYVMRAMGFNPQTVYRDVSSQIIGVNVEHPRGAKLLDGWICAAEKKVPFLEPNGDQLSIGALFNEYRMLDCELPGRYYQVGGNTIKIPNDQSPAIFYHQYLFLDSRLDLSPWLQ